MKIAGLATSNLNGVPQAVASASGLLYRELFSWAKENDSVSIVNNSILVHLGLIKVCGYLKMHLNSYGSTLCYLE